MRARSALKSSRNAATPPSAAAGETLMAAWKLFCHAWSLTGPPPSRSTL